MMPSLAIALLLAAALGADAAPQARSKQKAEVSQIARMVTITGECTKLVQAGLALEGCKPVLMNLNYGTG